MTETVRIERMSYGPAAVGRLSDGKTVFVEGAVPGDVAEVQLCEETPRFARSPRPIAWRRPARRAAGGAPGRI